MVSKKLIKLKILLKQNLYAFLIIFLWFISNLFYFLVITNSLVETIFIIFYFKLHHSLYGNFYDHFSAFIIFGLTFSLITVELFRKYNPAITSREISKKYSDHAVIIGYTHIGQRIVEYLTSQGIKVVIVEKNYDLIEDLISKEEAVVNDTPLSIQTLEDAGIRKSKMVFVMSDDFEIQMVVNSNVRKLNPHCKLVGRIFQDDIGDLISKTYNAEIISTSKYASEVIFNKIRKSNYKNILVIGLNHISYRLIKQIQQKPYIKFCLIEEEQEIIEELMDDKMIKDLDIIHGDPKEFSILQKANVGDIDCVINTIPDVKNSILISKDIRDLNSRCKIISRFFLDSVAEILEKPPFRSEVISSSKQTLAIMIQKGMFRF